MLEAKTMVKVLCVKCGDTADGCGLCGMAAWRVERKNGAEFQSSANNHNFFSALLFSISKGKSARSRETIGEISIFVAFVSCKARSTLARFVTVTQRLYYSSGCPSRGTKEFTGIKISRWIRLVS